MLLLPGVSVYAAGVTKLPGDQFPTVAENQSRSFAPVVHIAQPVANVIHCRLPCFDTDCEKEGWVYFGEAVCRTDVNGNQSCTSSAGRFCMKKQLDTGFYKCETCFY